MGLSVWFLRKIINAFACIQLWPRHYSSHNICKGLTRHALKSIWKYSQIHCQYSQKLRYSFSVGIFKTFARPQVVKDAWSQGASAAPIHHDLALLFLSFLSLRWVPRRGVSDLIQNETFLCLPLKGLGTPGSRVLSVEPEMRCVCTCAHVYARACALGRGRGKRHEQDSG